MSRRRVSAAEVDLCLASFCPAPVPLGPRECLRPRGGSLENALAILANARIIRSSVERLAIEQAWSIRASVALEAARFLTDWGEDMVTRRRGAGEGVR